jgi:integrase
MQDPLRGHLVRLKDAQPLTHGGHDDMTTKTRRPKGSGSIRDRSGDPRRPRWFAEYPAVVSTYRCVLSDGTVLVDHTTEDKARRRQRMRGGRVETDGERRAHVSRGPFSRKADAETWLRDELARVREGRPTNPERRNVRVGTVLDEWFAVRRHSLAATTQGVYESIIRDRLRPAIGSVKLADLRPAQIARMLDDLRQPGSNRRGVARDRGLSETSIQHVFTVLRTALQWAVRQRLISHNPADDVDRPQRARTEMRIWTSDQLATFLDYVRDDRLYPLLRTAAMTGARRSELLGIRWSDVDLDAGTVSISRARVRVRDGMHEAPSTKTGKSRVVDVDPVTVSVLKRWRIDQIADRVHWGPAWQGSDNPEDGYVFTRENGDPVHADHVQQRFERLVKAASVPVIRFHDLRHTHASLLLAAGTPVLDVAKRIGHASAAMTLNVYGHAVPGQGQKAATTFANLVDGAGG